MLRKLEENVGKFDFTQPELDYILTFARFNEIQTKVFNRLTDKRGRQTIIQISMEENISTSTVNRVIKQIKSKILRVL